MYRTPGLNNGVRLMCLGNGGLRKTKNETNRGKTDLSREVLSTRSLTNFFIEDLKRIADLKISK